MLRRSADLDCMRERDWITVVSGLPRSGTSVMMQMLAAGGMAVLTDHVRQPDEDNPRGYFEYEPVKSLRTDASWVPLAVGKAVKVVHVLLIALPAQYQYRVILMQRRPEDVLASQRKMLERNGKPVAALPESRMLAAYASQMAGVEQWVSAQANFRLLEVRFESLFTAAVEEQVQAVAEFCGPGLDSAAMAGVIDQRLHRNRAGI
jgi:hypothetical protein